MYVHDVVRQQGHGVEAQSYPKKSAHLASHFINTEFSSSFTAHTFYPICHGYGFHLHVSEGILVFYIVSYCSIKPEKNPNVMSIN